MDTDSFYEEFHTEPVGKCVIGICQSIACEVCGHQKLLDHVRDRLGIEPHETTDEPTGGDKEGDDDSEGEGEADGDEDGPFLTSGAARLRQP